MTDIAPTGATEAPKPLMVDSPEVANCRLVLGARYKQITDALKQYQQEYIDEVGKERAMMMEQITYAQKKLVENLPALALIVDGKHYTANDISNCSLLVDKAQKESAKTR